jgi:hypothetical protein
MQYFKRRGRYSELQYTTVQVEVSTYFINKVGWANDKPLKPKKIASEKY